MPAPRARPLHLILLAVTILHAVGIGWGLPASDTWEVDGVAPRDFLPGLIETFTPGHYFTYPPVHLALLAVLTLPITAVALVRAPSLAPQAVVREILAVPYMTGMALVARLCALAMSIGIVYAVGKMVEEVRGRRAGLFAAAVCGVNVPLTYYAHTSNLDVPYLFWGTLALLALTRAIVRGQWRRLRHVAVLAALAVGTKDQAYALFVLSVPVALLLCARANGDSWPRGLARELALAAGLGALVLLVVDGALVNPAGFRARLGFLAGSASQDFAQYSRDAAGRVRAVVDSVLAFDDAYVLPLAAPVLAGIGVTLVRERGAKQVAALVPLLAAVSFTLAFNGVARRVEHRFVMPQTVLLAAYAGIGLDALFDWAARSARPWWQGAAWAAVASTFAVGVFQNVNVDVAMLLDPRYDAEAWLRAHVQRGETVEVHGLNVYLPRFPEGARVVRVGRDPPEKRNPLPGVIEVRDAYERASYRRPHWIVVSRGFAWRYLGEGKEEREGGWGRVVPTTHRASSDDDDAREFFRGLYRGDRGYRLAHVSAWSSDVWPRVDIHASLGCEIRIFERER